MLIPGNKRGLANHDTVKLMFLGTGTYYISIKVVPNLPVTSSSTETVTVNFGYNVISGASVPVPT